MNKSNINVSFGTSGLSRFRGICHQVVPENDVPVLLFVLNVVIFHCNLAGHHHQAKNMFGFTIDSPANTTSRFSPHLLNRKKIKDVFGVSNTMKIVSDAWHVFRRRHKSNHLTDIQPGLLSRMLQIVNEDQMVGKYYSQLQGVQRVLTD